MRRLKAGKALAEPRASVPLFCAWLLREMELGIAKDLLFEQLRENELGFPNFRPQTRPSAAFRASRAAVPEWMAVGYPWQLPMFSQPTSMPLSKRTYHSLVAAATSAVDINSRCSNFQLQVHSSIFAFSSVFFLLVCFWAMRTTEYCL